MSIASGTSGGYVARRPYAQPPIQEALFQVVFAERLPWNVATPGRLFNEISDIDGGDPEDQRQISASLEPEGGGGGTSFALNQGESRTIFRSADRSRFVIANPSYLTVGSNPPYDGWPSLSARLEWLLDRAQKLWELPKISLVSIRYINQIIIPSGQVNTDDYFTYPIRTACSGSASLTGFVHRIESIIIPDTSIRTTFATMPEMGGGLPFLLDLEFLRPMDPGRSAIDIGNELKNLENIEFESFLTDKARELFR